MKPTLALTDYTTLRRLLRYPGTSAGVRETSLLEGELNKARVVDDHQVGREIVRLNSRVTIHDEKTEKISVFQIVLPHHADLKSRKVSALAPMGIALLGFKEGDSFDWEMPGGMKRIRIVSVENEVTSE